MKVLISIFSTKSIWTLPESLVDDLRARFPELTIVNASSDAALRAEVADADAALSTAIRAPHLALARRLKWIHSSAAGVGSMLFPEMVASDVVLTNSRGLHVHAMAEHTIGLALALTRDLHTAAARRAARTWAQDELMGAGLRTLGGRVLGLVGFGAVGSAVGRLAAAIGMRVQVVRRRPDEERPAFVERVYGPEALDGLLRIADVLVLATPLTRETCGWIGSRELHLMKPDAILINIGRGKVVREDELARELARGTIAGAGLDVFAEEPLDSTSPLWDLPNVFITPHTSSFHEDYWGDVIDLFAENLRRFLGGEPLLNVVDKYAGY